MSKASFMLGFIAGVTSVGGVAKKEATMYSYNGVVLPKLPEWDKTTYPYAFIVNHSTKGYMLVIQDVAETTNKAGNVAVLIDSPIQYAVVDGAWKESSLYSTSVPIVWSNHDVYYKTDDDYGDLSGALYMSASAPIPVYE